MTPASGGRTIALVGADGSGKSTLVEAVVGWLGWKLQVRSYYMGSKAPSRTSRWLYLAFRAFRRGHRSASGRIGPAAARPIAAVRDAALALHHLSIGRDRARRYRAAERDARAGRVVIFDRFPLETLSSAPLHRLLDGPQIAEALGDSIGPITRRLAAREERLYRRFRLPDGMVVLQVSPEVSVLRKPDHLPDVLAAKSRATLDVATLAEANGEVDVIRIDADRPLDQVLLDIQARLWDVL
jgi:thymidylate kinase